MARTAHRSLVRNWSLKVQLPLLCVVVWLQEVSPPASHNFLLGLQEMVTVKNGNTTSLFHSLKQNRREYDETQRSCEEQSSSTVAGDVGLKSFIFHIVLNIVTANYPEILW